MRKLGKKPKWLGKNADKKPGTKSRRRPGVRSPRELPGRLLQGGSIPMAFLVALAMLCTIAPDCVAGVQRSASGYEFTYEDPGAASVSLAGSFNNWNTNANPMTKDDKGVWRVVTPLAPGKHEYKYVVNGSSWVADPDNPVVVGDYGNSQVEIDAEGNVVEKPAARRFSNTTLSSRVAINGYFRATYPAASETSGDERLRLKRPDHDFNMDVNIKASDNVNGSVRIRFDTGVGVIQETQGLLYSGHLDLIAPAFKLKGYYNEELLSFDEPLELLGHEDLRGTIKEEHIAYGRGTQGGVFRLQGFGLDGTGLFTNVYDYDRFNNPAIYDNTDTDVMGARLAKEFEPGGIRAGLSWLRKQNGWWVDFTSRTAGRDSFKLPSTSDWFEIGTADQTLAADVRFVLPRSVNCSVEYAYWSWNAAWDVGNHERLEGTNLVNGAIDVPVGKDSGHRFILFLERKAGEKFGCSISHEIQRYKAMRTGDLYVDFVRTLLTDPPVNQFAGIGSIPGFSIQMFPPLPERRNDITDLDLSFGFGSLKGLVQVDRARTERDYSFATSVSPAFPSTQTNVWWRIAPSISLGPLAGRLTVGLDYEYSQNDPRGQFSLSFPLTDKYGAQFYDTRELIVSGKLSLTQQFSAVWDVRRMVYAANEGQLPAPQDSYVSPYFAFVYAPSSSIELRLGYHVNPTYYIDAPVEGRGNGRQIWRDAYMWESGKDIFAAERALSDVRMITLMGVMSF